MGGGGGLQPFLCWLLLCVLHVLMPWYVFVFLVVFVCVLGIIEGMTLVLYLKLANNKGVVTYYIPVRED